MLSSGSTLATAFTLLVVALPHTSHAACTSTDVGTYVCENTNVAGIAINGTDVVVETVPGFIVNDSSTTNSALTIAGSGSISYTDIHASVLNTDGSYSLEIQNDTFVTGQSASTMIETNGLMNSGILINNNSNGGSSIVNFSSNNMTAGANSLTVMNANMDGDVITDINIGGDIHIYSNDVFATTIDSYANEGAISLKFRANNIIAGYSGMNVNASSSNGSILTDIALTGDITARSGQGMNLNLNSYKGDINTSIKLSNISAYYEGIQSYSYAHSGNSLFNLDISGNVDSQSRAGILISNGASEGNSILNVNANNIIASDFGLYLSNNSSGGDAVTSTTVIGDIVARYAGATIQTTSSLGDVTSIINLNNVTSDIVGIQSYTQVDSGISTTDLTVDGQINADQGINLYAMTNNGHAIVTLDVNDMTTEYDAIRVISTTYGGDDGLSTIDAITRGTIVSQQGYGVYLETNTADTYLTVAGLVHGGNGTAVGIYRLSNAEKSASLELQPGYVLEGTAQALVIDQSFFDPNLASLDLANSHLVLGGASGNANFDLTKIDNREEAITDGDPNRITGFGTLVKKGDSVWMLTGSNSADDSVNSFLSVNVNAGILALNNATLGLTTSVAVMPTPTETEADMLTVADGATLSSIGSSSVIGNVTNAGEIRLSNGYARANGAFTGDSLTIAGNYTGNGASIFIDTQLGNDSSFTDKLFIQGDATSTTSITVNNVGGMGDQTNSGITIIDVGGVSFNNAFLLKGDYVTADGKPAIIGGAYAYTLQASGEEASAGRDWSLSSKLNPTDPGPSPENPDNGSALRYQPGVPLYEQYPQVLAALNTLPTLQQRVGNRYWSTELSQNNVSDAPWAWGRIEGNHEKADPAKSTSGSQRDIDQWKLQTGLDIPLHQGQDGSLLTGGVNFSYGKAQADIHSFFGAGSIDSSGYGIGTTLTWYGNDGIYVDGQLQTMWFDSGLSSDTLGQSMVSDNHGRGYASSIETGKRYSLGYGLSLTPQTQLTYSRVDFEDFRDPFGSEVSLQEGDSLRGRLGVSLDKDIVWRAEDGTTRRSHVYGNVDVYNEFMNGTKVNVSGVDFSTRDKRQSVGVGVGGTHEWQNGRYAVYGNVNLLSATHNVSDNYSIGGSVGVRIGW
ncbi:autotransporter outer membrane beta-barrel domain-containing protein [Budvicia aquatica]|nr:autotransporter outer membrane beta-barrel domain-containing protein [Budvicia aquatica]